MRGAAGVYSAATQSPSPNPQCSKRPIRRPKWKEGSTPNGSPVASSSLAASPRPSLTQSSFRRRTSPARSTWAMPSTIRFRTFSSASSGCGAATRSGSPAPTMPASPPRWWSSACSRRRIGPTAGPWAVRPSSSASGPGRRNRAAPFPSSSVVLAPPAIGAVSASRWTRACRRPCSRFSSSSTGKA